jgi:hypothetical protein
MRRRVTSPVPPFDTVPFYVVEGAKRAFLLRITLIEACLIARDAGQGNRDLGQRVAGSTGLVG